MGATIIVMLLFVHGHNGPAVISGFQTKAACDAAIPLARSRMLAISNLRYDGGVVAECVELAAG